MCKILIVMGFFSYLFHNGALAQMRSIKDTFLPTFKNQHCSDCFLLHPIMWEENSSVTIFPFKGNANLALSTQIVQKRSSPDFRALKMLFKNCSILHITFSHIVWKLLKMSHFGIFHQLFVQLKLTCLVILFDRKLQVFKMDHFWHF